MRCVRRNRLDRWGRRRLAVGEESGAAKALLDLSRVLDDISNALSRNRDNTRGADEQAEEAMKKAGGSW